MSQLGSIARLVPVELRSFWPHEDRDFTEWLAQPDGLAELARSLGLGSLTREGPINVSVGEFYADIVARDDRGERVVIENQLEVSDHDHLGKLLVYLVGLEAASTVVWITRTLRERHRAVLEWLNENTPESFLFFGVEVSLVRIDDSRPAPQFKVVVRPNSSRQRPALNSDRVRSEEELWYHAYWASFAEFLEMNGGADWLRPAPYSKWWGGGLGRTGFRLYATVARPSTLSVMLEIDHPQTDQAVAALVNDRSAIESEFGEVPLTWTSTPKRYRIVAERVGSDIGDPDRWPEQHAWFLEFLDRFRRVFKDRIAVLDLEPGLPMSLPGMTSPARS